MGGKKKKKDTVETVVHIPMVHTITNIPMLYCDTESFGMQLCTLDCNMKQYLHNAEERIIFLSVSPLSSIFSIRAMHLSRHIHTAAMRIDKTFDVKSKRQQ